MLREKVRWVLFGRRIEGRADGRRGVMRVTKSVYSVSVSEREERRVEGYLSTVLVPWSIRWKNKRPTAAPGRRAGVTAEVQCDVHRQSGSGRSRDSRVA